MRSALLTILIVAVACADGGDSSSPTADALASSPAPSMDLSRLLACNDTAIGGDLLRSATRVDYDLDIWEPTFQATGHYFATRDGEMRIDVYLNGKRVFSEGRDATHAWELPQDAAEPLAASEDGAAALRHGIEQPGHLWTLADMSRSGHAVELEDRETIDGVDYYVIRLTLEDGFQIWYWLNPSTCMIDRSRNFRAYHPDVDPKRHWTQSLFEGYEPFDGIRKPRVTRDVDLTTGDTVGRTTIRTFATTRSQPTQRS